MKRRVLMALMGLEIGGAETHVVELSRALKRQGYDVAVVSNGGVYEKELTDAGIRCYHAPLNRRRLGSMLRSLFLLRRIIKREQPDVVHAHARIPAFLCGILHRTMHFPFVTSAHWVFYVNRWLKWLTDWGERTVAVSDDIRQYLLDNYGIPAEHISVTINGIDTEKFSPSVSGERLLREFGLSPERPTVSYVSRMDESRALAARQLVAIAPQLRRELPAIQILIAGGGDVFDEVYAAAEKVNDAVGERFVVMTGARTDINEVVAAGDVFVGVSRAALEAMAAAKPVVVAGNEGYIGLFDRDKLTLAQESNFCCRGCPAPTEETLLHDLLRAFAMDETQRKALGDYGREVIGQYYSVMRMAQDCEKAYEEVLPHRVVLSGYYGFSNLGDDSILLALRDRIRRLCPNAEIVALSNRPKETKERCGIDAVYRFHPIAVHRAVRRCTLLLSGGGSLLQDRTSTRSLLYYTSLIRLAHRYGKRVMFYANGIGPVISEANRARVREVSEMADFITLRDNASLTELQSMGVKNDRIAVTADPVYSMTGLSRERGTELLHAQGAAADRPMIGVSVRFARGMDTNIQEFAAFCDALSEQYSVVFLGMQQPQDTLAATQIHMAMKKTAYFVTAPYDPQGMMAMLSCMDAVVSTRLHSIIFAARMLVPVLGIVYDPKVRACLDELGMPDAGTLADFSAEKAEQKLHELLEKRETYVGILRSSVAELESRANENESYLHELL